MLKGEQLTPALQVQRYCEEEAGHFTPLSPTPCAGRKCKDLQPRRPRSTVGIVSAQGWVGFTEDDACVTPPQNGQQPSHEHGGLLSRPCPHAAEGVRCACRGRLGLHRHGYRVMHLGSALVAVPEGRCGVGSS